MQNKIESSNKSNIDPVCGMRPTEGISFIYKGIKYSFCSDHCKRQFEQDPENYIAKQP